jgi:hypothetical protein
MCNGSIGGVEAGERDAGLRGQPLDGCLRDGAGDDLNLCGGNLLGGLCCVAAVSKEARSAARDGQRGAGACESREVAEVGKTGDQQAVKPGFGQTAAQKADAMRVVHSLRINHSYRKTLRTISTNEGM